MWYLETNFQLSLLSVLTNIAASLHVVLYEITTWKQTRFLQHLHYFGDRGPQNLRNRMVKYKPAQTSH